MRMPAVPAGEQLLLLYVAHLSQRVCHGTVRSYLSAIRHLHLSKGLPDPLKGTPRLDLALRGMRRRKPRVGDTRLPITPWVLSIIGQTPVHHFGPYDQLMLWAACCLGFFAFLRSGEFTTPEGSKFDPALHLTPLDLAVDNSGNPSAIKLHLKASKTDISRQGVDIFVGRTHNALCPVVALLRYLSVRGFDNGPLFQWRDGSPLTRQALVAKVRQILSAAGIEASHYSGHSFRIGAATTAAANGISDATIQTLGRWKSDSYCRYIRPPDLALASMSRTLAS